MITLIQRVTSARVTVGGEIIGEIGHGLLLFVGVEAGDSPNDADTTARKIASMRVFPGRTPTDLAVGDRDGSCLVISQFTLAADLRHGNRPDFTAAAPPAPAADLYQRVASNLAAAGLRVATGRFGASMQVESCNDGPVSLILTVREGKVVARH
ncbi:MAG: D-tyrosyl-tRNA(Tyr) deacylase [Planctomycetes bacterium]|nr:D-tyrosyl-tRNA(Tyr) deacylase [Planctomycetota bacterium]